MLELFVSSLITFFVLPIRPAAHRSCTDDGRGAVHRRAMALRAVLVARHDPLVLALRLATAVFAAHRRQLCKIA